MKKLLLTGASSYLGARLYLDLSTQFDAIGTYGSHQLSKKFIQLDVTKSDEVHRVLDAIKPDIIIHAANNASASWCDAHPDEAVTLNQLSMQHIIDAAEAVNAKIIYISSFSADDHSTMYGKTKHEAERMIKKTKTPYLIIRPSLILGFSPNTVNDRPFNRILKNIDEKVSAVYDTTWKFQPTYIRHISEVIRQVIEKNIWNKTISVAVPETKSRFDVAKDILTPFGISVLPVDANTGGVSLTDDLKTLHDLGLPEYSYKIMIDEIVEEIINRNKYII